MAVLKNIVAITGKYTDRNGNEKNQYTTIGRVVSTSKGESIKIDVVPLGWDGWAGLYDPQPREAKEPAKANGYAPGSDDDIDDRIPF